MTGHLEPRPDVVDLQAHAYAEHADLRNRPVRRRPPSSLESVERQVAEQAEAQRTIGVNMGSVQHFPVEDGR